MTASDSPAPGGPAAYAARALGGRVRDARRRCRAELRTAAPAMAGYALVRLVGLAIFWLMARRYHADPLGELGSWDGVWYRRIAADGYDPRLVYRPDGRLRSTGLAFSPAYPMLIRGVSAVSGMSVLVAGVVISGLAGLAAAWGIAKVGEDVADRRTGVLLAALWGVMPHAIVESMVYTESLFTALSAWSLHSVLRRRWVVAGILACAAGATRSAAMALVAAVVLAALAALVRRRDGWRPLATVTLAPAALVGFWAWVGYLLGRPDAWFYVEQAAWRMRFDGGRATLETFRNVLARPVPLVFYVSTLVVVVAVMLCALLAWQRVPWVLLGYAVLSVVMVVGATSYYYAKGRFLLPVFPLLLPVARLLARAPGALAAVVVVTLAIGSGWYGGYLLLVWPYSP